MSASMTSLERLYPNRCYDCLAVCPPGKVLCAPCEQVYADARRRTNSGRSPDA